jgi:hypothetical protein
LITPIFCTEMMASRNDICIGFRVHSGWAAMVAVARSVERPVIVDRRRIEFTSERGSVQPYHTARELGVERGRAFLEKCRTASNALANEALEAAIKHIGGDRVRKCAVLMGSGRASPSLEATLASHAAIHTAEGEFFRAVVIHAAESCGLRVRCIKEKQLFEIARQELDGDIQATLNDLGKIVGPPWTQDQKLATVAAWLA